MTHQEAVASLAAERYLLDEMAEPDREQFEEHYFQCEECADDLRAAAAMVRGARAGMTARSASTGPTGQVVSIAEARASARRAWYRSTTLPWAIAATLALVAGYESIRTSLPQSGTTVPIALEPITLRPASRGAEPVVHVAAGPTAAPIALAIELGDVPQGGDLGYDLKTVDGRPGASGVVAAPQPGAPLLLVMPSWTVVAPMHYILTVHDAAQPGHVLGEYRFAASAR